MRSKNLYLPCNQQATLDVGDATRDGTERLATQMRRMDTGVRTVMSDMRALQEQVLAAVADFARAVSVVSPLRSPEMLACAHHVDL